MKSTSQRRHTVAINAVLKLLYDESFVPRNILKRLILLWIILIFFPIGHRLSETSSPLNNAAPKGTKVRLNCSTTKKKELQWRVQNAGSLDAPIGLYAQQILSKSMRDLYSIDNSAGENADLSFSASENTSGKYICQSEYASGNTHTAHVIVLDAQPTCSFEEEAGFVKAKCSIGFSGFRSPKLEWRDANGALKPNDTTTSPNKHVSCSVTVPFNKADSYMLTCTPKFSLADIPQDTSATNIPEYPNSCTVPQKVIAPTSKSTDTSSRTRKTGGDKKAPALDPDSTPQSDISASSPLCTVSSHNGHDLYLSLYALPLWSSNGYE